MAVSKILNPEAREQRKRKRERWLIAIVLTLFLLLTFFEFKLTRSSQVLPFVNSIFFFGLLNLNIILLITLVWLVIRNVGKLFLEHRSKILGAKLKTKLVFAFLAFSIVPTTVLFIISSLYIHSSFDKWFSLKIQNTLEASLEITHRYYENAKTLTQKFATHLANRLQEAASYSHQPSLNRFQVKQFLQRQKQFLPLHVIDAIEFYPSPFKKHLLWYLAHNQKLPYVPPLAFNLLEKAFNGHAFNLVRTIPNGELVRYVQPVALPFSHQKSDSYGSNTHWLGVLVVNTYFPISLTHKVNTIANVFGDYQATNPLKYSIKTAYFSILVLITLMIVFVEIWMGLYLARQLTVPIEKLVEGVEAVGAGNLNFRIPKTGQDEITVLIEAFNHMTHALQENRKKLTQTTKDLQKRKLQLEAILANIEAGVIVIDLSQKITTFNRAAQRIFQLSKSDHVLEKFFQQVLTAAAPELVQFIQHLLQNPRTFSQHLTETTHWTRSTQEGIKLFAATATFLYEKTTPWGLILVIHDWTTVVKAQREAAWREVARRIAHEIKNPLTPIKLAAQRLQRRLAHLGGKDGHLVRNCTQIIVRHTDDLKEMVNAFSAFARFPEISLSPGSLQDILEEVLVLYAQAHPHIEFQKKWGSKLPIFPLDRDQIKRVFVNLFENSIYALSTLSDTAQKTLQVELYYNAELKRVACIVRDNGPGMPKMILERAFEPNFSTKKVGSGLGLAIVKRIIQDHHGTIQLKSELKVGTEFLIELPTSLKEKPLYGLENPPH